MNSAKLRWLQYERAVQALGASATELHRAGIRVVPVKGVVLARWLYDDVTERPLRDVDLLVPKASFRPAVRAMRESSYPLAYLSQELGEAVFDVDGFAVELHAEIGRRDLLSLSAADVVSRASLESETFGFEIARIDDVDHLLLLAANVVKDHFGAANPHQSSDIARLAGCLESRFPAVVARAWEADFVTGLHAVACWMRDVHGCRSMGRLSDEIGTPPRPAQSALLQLLGRLNGRDGQLALAVACWTNDALPSRLAALSRLAKRGLLRGLGRDPDRCRRPRSGPHAHAARAAPGTVPRP